MVDTKDIKETPVAEQRGFKPSDWTEWEEKQLAKAQEEKKHKEQNKEWTEDQNTASEVKVEEKPKNIGEDVYKPRARPIDKTLPRGDR